MKHANQFDIINIGRLACNETGIFTPFDRRANHRCNAHVSALSHTSETKRQIVETSYAEGKYERTASIADGKTNIIVDGNENITRQTLLSIDSLLDDIFLSFFPH